MLSIGNGDVIVGQNWNEVDQIVSHSLEKKRRRIFGPFELHQMNWMDIANAERFKDTG